MKDNEISRLVRAAKRLIVDFARPRQVKDGNRPETRIMCSWCHELNETAPELSVYCWCCGHRFDIPRAYCDCQCCEEEFQLAGGDA